MSSSRDSAQDLRELTGAMSSGFADTIRQDSEESFIPTERVAEEPDSEAIAILDWLARQGGHETQQRFDLHKPLGEGGRGIVHLARQVALDRDVAIKVLRPEHRSSEAITELLHEAWVTGSLEHPNVVPVHDMGLDDDGTPAIVLRRIDGVTWSQLLLDAEQVRERFGATDLLEWNLSILMQVLNAIRFAHSRCIVHRDLKPDNVMIGEFGEVYLLDWGIAVTTDDDRNGRLPRAADVTEMAGTPSYMAPEMLGRTGVPISERTDIYLLGATLFEILAGRPPHQGKTPMAIFHSAQAEPPALPDDAPAGLARICQRAMAPNPGQRYASADDMRRDLQDYLQHRGSEQLARQAATWFCDMQSILNLDSAVFLSRNGDNRRQRLYQLYGACRFGFRAALQAWSDNQAARAGLHQATQAMIEYELDQGDARAAAALLVDISHAAEMPGEVRERVEQALQADAAEKARLARLERLSREFDLGVGARTRTGVILFLGLGWFLVPLTSALISDVGPHYPGNLRMTTWSFAMAILVWVVAFLVRGSLWQSAINRRLVSIAAVMMAGQGVLSLGAEVGGILPSVAQMFLLFMWCCVFAMISITVDKRLSPTAVAYLIGFFAAALVPEKRLFVMAGANLVFLTNAVIVWRPGRTQPDSRANAKKAAPTARQK